VAEITKFHPTAGACLYDTERGDWLRDSEGHLVKVDRETGKPAGQITRCPHCGAIRRAK
jgi:hypothetical protein